MGSLSELRFVRFSGGRYKNDHHSPATYKTQHKHYTYTTQVCRVIQTAYTNTWRTLNITNTHTNVVGSSSDPNCCVSQQTTYKHTNRHSPVRMTRCTQVQQEFVLHTLIRKKISERSACSPRSFMKRRAGTENFTVSPSMFAQMETLASDLDSQRVPLDSRRIFYFFLIFNGMTSGTKLYQTRSQLGINSRNRQVWTAPFSDKANNRNSIVPSSPHTPTQ